MDCPGPKSGSKRTTRQEVEQYSTKEELPVSSAIEAPDRQCARLFAPNSRGVCIFVDMRIDKYLWCVRIYKTRSQAKEEIVAGRVSIDGEVVKASREVRVADEIQVRKKAIEYTYEVLDFPKSRVGPALVENFIDDITAQDELDKLELMKLQYKDVVWRQNGLGRPTKKQRRDLDKFRPR